MGSVKNVLVIENSEKLRHELSVVMPFCGFQVLLATVKNWKDEVTAFLDESDGCSILEVTAVFVGTGEKKQEALLDSLVQWRSDVPIVLLGGNISSETLPDQVRKQLVGYLAFPLVHSKLMSIMHSCYLCRESWQLSSKFKNTVLPNNCFKQMVGESQKMSAVRHAMQQVAKKNVIVFLTGESGTGKELAARSLHDVYASDKNFIPVNCSAIPPDLFERELFGYEKGAFNGADSARKGRLELAQGGTLFLDEIGDMPLSLQARLVRVLHELSFQRLGGVKSMEMNARIIVASQTNLEMLVSEGGFREDLFYRINGFPIRMPALRERPEDIPIIINDLLNKMERQNRDTVRLSSAALDMMCYHPWRGNIRELSNLLERLSTMFPYGVIGTNDLPREYITNTDTDKLDNDISSLFPDRIQAVETILNDNLMVLPAAGLNIREFLAHLEKSLIEQALLDSRGVVARAANKLQIRRTTLIEKMRKYSLQRHQKVD